MSREAENEEFFHMATKKGKKEKFSEVQKLVAQAMYSRGLSLSLQYPLSEMAEMIRTETNNMTFTRRCLKDELSGWVDKKLIEISNGNIHVTHDGLDFIEKLVDQVTSPGTFV